MAIGMQLAGTDPDLLHALGPVLDALKAEGLPVELEGHRGWARWGNARRRWVAGNGVESARAGTILWAPSAEEVERVLSRWPQGRVFAAQSLAGDPLREHPHVTVVPRIVPDTFYPPGLDADVFGVTQRFHLESRPRLIYFGGYSDGRALTRLLHVARRLLSLEGELILMDSMAVRASLAPVVQHLGLTEQVVFVPALTDAECAGLCLGADLILAVDSESTPRAAITAALATGTPVVAQYSPVNEALLGPAALWVYAEDEDLWVKAATKALEAEPVREELSRRALEVTGPWRQSESVSEWLSALRGSF